MQDGAIEDMLEEHLGKKFLFVSGNVINHPLLSHVHNRMGATLPFRPSHAGDGADWVMRPSINGLDDTFMGRAKYAYQLLVTHNVHFLSWHVKCTCLELGCQVRMP